MPANQELPSDLLALPDWAVLSDRQTIVLLGFSLDTLSRLDRAGDGPPRVRLSPRRYGRPVGELRKWIQKRVSSTVDSFEP
jgi:predicted DNA-binding transcriptional regulator AlpA